VNKQIYPTHSSISSSYLANNTVTFGIAAETPALGPVGFVLLLLLIYQITEKVEDEPPRKNYLTIQNRFFMNHDRILMPRMLLMDMQSGVGPQPSLYRATCLCFCITSYMFDAG
jgi:hypothetical protein